MNSLPSGITQIIYDYTKSIYLHDINKKINVLSKVGDKEISTVLDDNCSLLLFPSIQLKKKGAFYICSKCKKMLDNIENIGSDSFVLKCKCRKYFV